MSTTPATTGEQQAARDHGRFVPGRSGNPAGRPPGSKNRINGDFLRELSDHFAKEGRGAIERMCEEDPTAYVKVVASLLPKDVTIDARPFAQFSDEDLLAALDTIQHCIEAGVDPFRAGALEGEALALAAPDERS
jgi:hypothetical protein